MRSRFFEPKITLSGLIQIVLLVGGIASAMAVRDSDVRKLTERSQKIEERVEEAEEKVNELRTQHARREQENVDIQRRLADIQAKLDRLIEHAYTK